MWKFIAGRMRKISEKENKVSTRMEIVEDISAIDRAIDRVDAFIRELERLESAANRAMGAVNGMSDITIPPIPDIPHIQNPAGRFDIDNNIQGDIDIFNGSGAERYRQEIEALDAQMRELISSQTRIDSLADSMDVIPDSMITDVNALNQRIEALGSSIQNIEREEIDDMGADRVNNQLEELRRQLSLALQSQNALNGAVRNMDLSEAQRQYQRLNEIISRAERNIRESINIPPIPPPAPPPPIPIEWDVPRNIDVFKSGGAERYRQEINALDVQMRELMNNQTRIDSLADNMDVIPDSMITDVNALNQRILALSNSIQAIERERIDDIGANRVNNQLEQMRSRLSAALQSQNALNGAIKNMNASEAQREYQRLNDIINGAERNIRDNINGQRMFNDAVRQGNKAAVGLMGQLRQILGIYASIRGIGKVISLSDKMTQSSARLEMIVDDNGSVDALRDKIFDVAQSSRADYLQTMDMIGKLGVQAGDSFNSNDELLAFADQLNKQFAIAGTDAQGIAAATLQLTQALGSGVLRGEELNSVFEHAPNIMRTVADYLGKDIGEMRKLASEGQLTADVVKNALLDAAEKTNAEFENMPLTFSQIWTGVKNEAVMAFQPVLDKMSELANSEEFKVFVESAINALCTLADVALIIFDIICSGVDFMADNWSWLGPIIEGAAVALGIAAVALGVATAAQWLFNTALLGCPLIWIILVIGAVAAAVIWLADKLGGLRACWELVKMSFELGCLKIEAAWELLKAGVMYVINSMIVDMIKMRNKVLNTWDLMSLGISAACTAIQNFIGDMKAGALEILQDMINGAIGLINDFISAVNSIGVVEFDLIEGVTFGTEAAAENEAEKAARNAALNEEAKQFVADMEKRDAELNLAINNRDKSWDDSMKKIEDIGKEMEQVKKDGMAAYNAAKLSNIVGDVSDAADKASGNDLLDGLGIPGAGMEDISNIDKVGKVDKVGGTVDVSSEDLKRLRDIYENDIIQEVYVTDVTPQVNIKFGDVRETADIKKIVREIRESIKEGINIGAEGVH